MDDSVKSQIKAQYPNLTVVPIVSADDGIEIIVTGADHATWAKYQGMKGDFADAGKRSQADELLVLNSMVWPDKDKFRQELEARHLTGFYTAAAREIAKLTGLRESIRVGEAL